VPEHLQLYLGEIPYQQVQKQLWPGDGPTSRAAAVLVAKVTFAFSLVLQVPA
jgi:hypothetical protein